MSTVSGRASPPSASSVLAMPLTASGSNSKITAFALAPRAGGRPPADAGAAPVTITYLPRESAVVAERRTVIQASYFSAPPDRSIWNL